MKNLPDGKTFLRPARQRSLNDMLQVGVAHRPNSADEYT